jgi:hypothetical protein
VVKENSHARIAKGGPTTAPIPPTALHLNKLWMVLGDQGRQRMLVTLSQIIAKQLQPPPREKEVEHENG